MHNNTLKLLSLFFLLLSVMVSHHPVRCGIIDILNGLVLANLPKINDALHENIPDSFGNCNDNAPPAPCQCSAGCADLYNVHKSWEYKAYARWISGLRTGNISGVVFSLTGNIIYVDIKGFFEQLPLSLWVGECLTFDQCVKIWDNTNGCCGNNKHFGFAISVDCKNDFPYLYAIHLVNLTLDKFEITEKIIGIDIPVDDITNNVYSAVSGLLTSYLTTEQFIPYNGTKVNLLAFANYEIQAFTKGGFACPTSFEKKYIFE